MSTYNTTNIKNLPQIEEVVNGNYLIIENEIGTNILDFKDFIVGPDNVSFYSNFQNLCTYSISMSATVDSEVNALSSEFFTKLNTTVNAASSKVIADTQTKINTLSTDYTSKFNTLTSIYPKHFEGYPYQQNNGVGVIKIDVSDTYGEGVLVCPINTLIESDFTVIPVNAKAGATDWLLKLFVNPTSVYPPSTGYTYTVRISSGAIITNTAPIFSVKASKFYY